MPIYDYKCQDCGKVSELFFRSDDSEDINCPHCGSRNLKRLISAPHVIKMNAPMPGTTCCGRTGRCEAPPCFAEGTCRRE